MYRNNSLSSSLAMLDLSLEVGGPEDDVEGALNSYLMADMVLDETEAGRPLLLKKEKDELYVLEERHKLSFREIILCSLYLAPVWFITEVIFSTFCSYTEQLYLFPQ